MTVLAAQPARPPAMKEMVAKSGVLRWELESWVRERGSGSGSGRVVEGGGVGAIWRGRGDAHVGGSVGRLGAIRFAISASTEALGVF